MRFAAFTVVLFLVAVSAASAGLFDNLTDKIPSIDSITREKPAISTSIKDAVTEVPFLDDFDPTEFQPMMRLPRGPNNGFSLERPGLFEFEARSYCLHAGTYGPTKGDGYLYAPLSGPRAGVIQRIARESVVHPEIEQHDIQLLIWAILARTKISDMSPELQAVAAKLLTSKDIADLNGGALGVLSDELMSRAMDKVSDAIRPIFEAECRLRDMFTTADSTYEQIEQVAVLTGEHEPGPGSREVCDGRWSYHPQGYFVRYFPSGYSQTLIQLYVPEAFVIRRDSAGRITSIWDALGNRIETEYDDACTPVAVSGDSAVTAHVFKSIRFVNVHHVGTELTRTQTAKWDNIGWTFVGIPGGKGKPSASERFAGIADRYSAACETAKQVRDLLRNVHKARGVKGDAPAPNADVMDLAHYWAGIRSAIGDHVDAWTAEQKFMVQRAWQSSLASLAGEPPMQIAYRSYLVASADLAGLLAIGADDGPCDQPPPKPDKPKEFDPSDGTATPGDTGDQRLLETGAPANPDDKPDCKHVANRMKELQTIYDAFKNNLPVQGEDGDAYYNRILRILGYDESKGGVSPMGTDPNSCLIIVNESLYANEPAISRASDCAHEKSHQARCRWARDHAAGGYPSWMMDANNYRVDEMAAYQAGMDAISQWQKQNGCE